MATALIRVALLVGLIQGRGEAPLSDVEVTGWLEESLSYVVGAEVFTRDHSMAVDREARTCADDVGCIADRSAAAGATHSLLAIVDLESRAISLQLVDTKLRTSVASSLGSLPREGEKKTVKDRASQLFAEAGFASGGRLTFRGTPADARIALSAGGKLTELALPAVLPAGTHQLHLSRDGYDSIEEEVTIVGGTESSLDRSLSESPGIVESPWLWIGVGVAAIGAGVGTYFLARPRQGTLCQGEALDCR